MSFDVAKPFFGVLAIAAGLGAVAIVIARLVPAGRPLLAQVRPIAGWLAWLVAATATGGSLYFSESVGLPPCNLCWYQRIAMYSLAVVLLVGAIRRDPGVRVYAIPLAAIGLAISIYHRLIEANPSWEGSGVCDISLPCSAPYFYVFEIFTLSMMAMCGFAMILALLLFVPSFDDDGDELVLDDAPRADEEISLVER